MLLYRIIPYGKRERERESERERERERERNVCVNGYVEEMPIALR
jgi:hypothetical protein